MSRSMLPALHPAAPGVSAVEITGRLAVRLMND